MDNDTQLFKKIKDRMDLIPNSPNLSERGAYDAYLNVLNWIREAYVPTATSHSVKDVEGNDILRRLYLALKHENIEESEFLLEANIAAEEYLDEHKSSPIEETKTAASEHCDRCDVKMKNNGIFLYCPSCRQ